METSELLKKVRKIEIKTKGLSKHIFAGEYHSAFKGRGMSFSEVRDYAYGDDVRNIDWNVTARTGTPFVKIFEEERELTVILMIDISGSAFFGTKERFKNELITEIAAVLAFSAIINNDKVGAILFTDKVEKYIPPSKGKKNILHIIRELINLRPENKSTDIRVALEYLNNVQKKRAIVFLISDFRTPDFEQPLMIASKRHDVIGMNVYDHREYDIPSVGLIRLRDSESGTEKIIDSSDRHTKKLLRQHFQGFYNNFREKMMKNGCDVIDVRTDEDYVKSLLQFFKKRSA